MSETKPVSASEPRVIQCGGGYSLHREDDRGAVKWRLVYDGEPVRWLDVFECNFVDSALRVVAPSHVAPREDWTDFDKAKPLNDARVTVRLWSGTVTDCRYWDGDFECECATMPRWITGNKVHQWRPQ